MTVLSVPVVTVLAVGGTGESFPGDDRRVVSGLLGGVTKALDARFESQWVAYPASYGMVPARDGMSYQASVDKGIAALCRALRAGVGPVMLIGYSQGAVVIRAVLGMIARGDFSPARRIIGAGFIADPHQPPGAVAGLLGQGIAGDGPPVPRSLATLWVGHPDDFICNASTDSFLRDVADLTGAFTLRNMAQWIKAMTATLRSRQMQNAQRTSIRPAQWLRDVGRLGRAIREVFGYLPAVLVVIGLRIRNPWGGRHTSYAVEPLARHGGPTGCEVLAEWMRVQVTFALGVQVSPSYD